MHGHDSVFERVSPSKVTLSPLLPSEGTRQFNQLVCGTVTVRRGLRSAICGCSPFWGRLSVPTWPHSPYIQSPR